MTAGKDLSRIKENPKGIRFSELQKAIMRDVFTIASIVL